MSLGSSKMEETDERQDKFHCSICLNPYTKPKIIECFHTFCEGCLKNYISRYLGSGSFPCPLCRQNVKIPAKGIEGFMTNFYLEEKKVEKIVVPKTPQCEKHKREIDLYCVDCCKTICSKCFISDHSRHTATEIEQIADTSRQELDEVKLNLVKNLTALEKCKNHIESEIKEFQTATEKELEKVDNQVMDICKIVNRQGKQFQKEIKKIAEREKEKLSVHLNDIKLLIKDTESLNDNTSELLKTNNPHSILAHLAFLKVKSIESGNRACLPILSVTYPKFRPNSIDSFQPIDNFGQLETNIKSPEFIYLGNKPSTKVVGNKPKISKSKKTRRKPLTFGFEAATRSQILDKDPAFSRNEVSDSASSENSDDQLETQKVDNESRLFVKPDDKSKSPGCSQINILLENMKLDKPTTSKAQHKIENDQNENHTKTSEKEIEKEDYVGSCTDDKIIDGCVIENNTPEVLSNEKHNAGEKEHEKMSATSDERIFGKFPDREKKDVNSTIKTFGDFFKFDYGHGSDINIFKFNETQYDFRFDLNSILEKGSKCRKVPNKTSEYVWVMTVCHENTSRLSLSLDLDTLGLYRVSFSIQLVNLENDKNSVSQNEKCVLLHGVWGPGYKWNNFVNLDLLADTENKFLDCDQQFLIRLTVEDDIYRLK